MFLNLLGEILDVKPRNKFSSTSVLHARIIYQHHNPTVIDELLVDYIFLTIT